MLGVRFPSPVPKFMNTEDLIKVYESLKECSVDAEDFCWGPTYELACERRRYALKLLENQIKLLGVSI